MVQSNSESVIVYSMFTFTSNSNTKSVKDHKIWIQNFLMPVSPRSKFLYKMSFYKILLKHDSANSLSFMVSHNSDRGEIFGQQIIGYKIMIGTLTVVIPSPHRIYPKYLDRPISTVY